MEVASNQPVDKSEESSKSGDGSNSQKSSSSSSQSLTSLSSQSSGYDQPSTSGCSSDVPGETKRKNSHKKKLKKFISEMKSLVPPDRLYGSKARTLVALSHALACMKRMKNAQENSNAPVYPVNEAESTPHINFNNFKAEFSLKNGDGFAAAILEGVVLDVSNSITELLGYPKDMLLGKHFEDFINPKDRMGFRSQMAVGLNNPLMDHGMKNGNQCTFFLRMRIHRGQLTSALNLPDKRVVYKTFEVVLCTLNTTTDKSFPEDARNSAFTTPSAYFILKAAPVMSAYKDKEETPVMIPFTTRHNANCFFDHIQPSAIPYVGYLPQDIVGNSIFDYYHPEDLSNMKESYEHVIQEQGRPFLGKPYRFRVHNGCHILLATEWSCFINPWTKKLEFVIGQHHVLKGPAEPNVFLECEAEDGTMSDDPTKESCNIQNEIKQILSETIDGQVSTSGKDTVVQRHTSVGSYMGNLIQDMVLNMPQQVEKHGSKGTNYSNRSSVVMGEISPHHKDSDSDSSETPPSYNHINYADHIQRYFDSQPKTHSSDTSAESKEGDRDMDEEQKSIMPGDSSSSDRSGNQTSSMNSSSNPEDSPTAQDPIPSPPVETNVNCPYRHVTLSEDVLNRHNEMTKKKFVQQHCEHRAGRSGSHYSRSDRDGKTGGMGGVNRKELQRLKRTNSQSPERDSPKINKHTHNEATGREDFSNPNASRLSATQVRMWPPFSLAVTAIASPSIPANQSSLKAAFRTISNMSIPTTSTSSAMPQSMTNIPLPAYAYIPTGQHGSPVPFNGSQGSGALFMPAVQYMNAMPGVVYHPVAPVVPQPGVGPIIVPNMAVYQPAIMIPRPVTTSAQISSPKDTYVVQSRKAPYTCSSACRELKTVEEVDAKSNHKHDLESSIPNHRSNSEFMPCLEHQNKTGYHNADERANVKRQAKVEPKDSMTSSCEKYCEENVDSSSFSHDDLSGSSLYSFLKSEKSDDSPKACSVDKEDMIAWDQQCGGHQEKQPLFHVAKEPPWMEGVTVTSDLIYRYQLDAKDVEEVLREDLRTLQRNHQPDLVNQQLQQMYNEQENVGPEKEFFGFGFDNESDYGDDGGIHTLGGLLATATKQSSFTVVNGTKESAAYTPVAMEHDFSSSCYSHSGDEASKSRHKDSGCPQAKHKEASLDQQPESVEMFSMMAGPS